MLNITLFNGSNFCKGSRPFLGGTVDSGLRAVLIMSFFCEGPQIPQKQLRRQGKILKIAKVESAHNPRKSDFWVCGGYGLTCIRMTPQACPVH